MKYQLRSHAALRIKLYQKMLARLGLSRELRRGNIPQPDTYPLTKIPRYTSDLNTADMVIENACLSGSEKPVSIAISDKRIIAKGDRNELAGFYTEKTKVISAAGKTVAPAFTDSHLHLLVGAERIFGCDIEGCTTVKEMTELINEFGRKNPDLPVIHAYGLAYMNPPLLPAENARSVLDNIVAEKPLFIYAHDLHTAWANTAALKETDMFEKMPPWPELLQRCPR